MKVNQNIKIQKPKKNSNLAITIVVGLIISGIAVGLFFLLQSVLATENYYVLNISVPAKTQIKPEMLEKVVTSKDTAPKNAISIEEVKQGTVYTRYALNQGDVLSNSNTGLDLDTSVGIPDDWSTTSFTLTADNAVGGNIKRGDYFDIIGITPENGAKYLFFNVLALDVKYGEVATVDAEGNKTQDNKAEITEQIQYVIGMPSDKVPILHHALAKYEKIKLVLSPNSLKYKERDVQDLTEIFLADNDLAPTDLYEGTDSTFSPVLRDSKGLPVNKINCDNKRIEPASLCDNIDKLEETEKKRRERLSSDTQTEDINTTDNVEETPQVSTNSAISPETSETENINTETENINENTDITEDEENTDSNKNKKDKTH